MWSESTEVFHGVKHMTSLHIYLGKCSMRTIERVGKVLWINQLERFHLQTRNSEHLVLRSGNGHRDEVKWVYIYRNLRIKNNRIFCWTLQWEREKEGCQGWFWGFWLVLYKLWIVVVSLFPGKITLEETRFEGLCIDIIGWIEACWAHVSCSKFLYHQVLTHIQRLGEKGQMKKDLCESNLALLGPDLVLNQCWDKHKRWPQQIFSKNPVWHYPEVCIQGWKWYSKKFACLWLPCLALSLSVCW